MDGKYLEVYSDRVSLNSIPSAIYIGNSKWWIHPGDFINLREYLRSKGEEDGWIEEEALEIVSKYVDLYTEALNIRQNYEDIAVPAGIKDKPFKDQLPAIRMALARQFSGNWDVMGAGKTFVALYTFAVLKEKGLAEKMLVFCPDTCKITWESHIRKHTDFACKVVGNGSKVVISDIKSFSFMNVPILIVHYDALINEKIRDLLSSMKFDMIVIDEAHNVKNIKAKRTKAVFYILNKVVRTKRLPEKLDGIFIRDRAKPHVIFLTGTPVSERPDNAYLLLKFLNPVVTQRAKFSNAFEVKKDIRLRTGYTIKKTVSFKNLRFLRNYFIPVSIWRKREELLGMPKEVIEDVDLELPPDIFNVYSGLRDDVIKDLSKEGFNNKTIKNKLMVLRQFVNHPALLGYDKFRSIKHEYILEVLESLLEEGARIVIWGFFRRGMEILKSEIESKFGKVCGIIYGGVSGDGIRRIVSGFNSGKLPVILASIEKAGEGVDFLKEASVAIYLDLPLSGRSYLQSKNRIVRKGKKGSVLILRPKLLRTVDNAILNLLKRKMDLLGQVQDVDSISLSEMVSFEEFKKWL